MPPIALKERCSSCNGRGVYYPGELPCFRCHGKGYIRTYMDAPNPKWAKQYTKEYKSK